MEEICIITTVRWLNVIDFRTIEFDGAAIGAGGGGSLRQDTGKSIVGLHNADDLSFGHALLE